MIIRYKYYHKNRFKVEEIEECLTSVMKYVEELYPRHKSPIQGLQGSSQR